MSLPDAYFLHVKAASARPGLERGIVSTGDLVVSLGFPAKRGLGPDGIPLDVQSAKVKVEPIPLIARVISASPLKLQLVAGAIPLGGASGSPICNLNGELVGLLTGVDSIVASDGDVVEVIRGAQLPEF